MPLKRIKRFLFGAGVGLAREDAMKIFRRDRFRCQYCGLDGLHVFENWLMLTIDHVHPLALGGTRRMDNLVTACRPCNLLKGKRVFPSREEARKFVLEKREEWRQQYEQEIKRVLAAEASR